MATRQTSSNGRPKSPRVQVVLPEDLCARLGLLAERESRTVSNMAKVLIQEGVKKHEQNISCNESIKSKLESTQEFISSLENQEPKRLKGAPKRLKLFRNK